MRYFLLFILCLSGLLLAQAQRAENAPGRTDAPRRENFSERFSVLTEHNIFLKDRSRPAQSGSATSRPAVTKVPEESLVLTGVVMEDDGFRAYIESSESQSITKVALGDTIARGRIVDMQINAVQYEHGSERRWIEMGCNFLGHAVAITSSVSSSTATTSPSAAGATQPTSLPFNANDPNLTIEQKMKLRRMQERKQ